MTIATHLRLRASLLVYPFRDATFAVRAARCRNIRHPAEVPEPPPARIRGILGSPMRVMSDRTPLLHWSMDRQQRCRSIRMVYQTAAGAPMSARSGHLRAE